MLSNNIIKFIPISLDMEQLFNHLNIIVSMSSHRLEIVISFKYLLWLIPLVLAEVHIIFQFEFEHDKESRHISIFFYFAIIATPV